MPEKNNTLRLGKGIFNQIEEGCAKKPITSKLPTLKDFEELINSINTTSKPKDPKMYINGVFLINMDDEYFKAFYGADNVVCTCSLSILSEIKERAKKLGLKEI